MPGAGDMPGKLSIEAIKLLKHGACTDAVHDFGHSMAFNKNGLHDSKKAGLPELKTGLTDIPGTNIPKGDDAGKGPDTWKDENEFIQAIFGSNEQIFDILPFVPGAKPYMYQFVQNIKEGIVDDNSYVKKMQIRESAEGNIDYDVKYLHLDRENADPLFDCKLFLKMMTLKNYAEFFEGAGANNVTLNILTDAQCINFVDLFRQAKQEGAKIKINKIINREVFNDPATKKYRPSDRDVKTANLMEDFLWDSENNSIMYPANDPVNIVNEPGTIHRNKFFSKFNFTLSQLLRNSDAEFIKKPTLNLVVTNPEDPTWKIDKTNPNKQNNIASCVKRIRERFDKKGMNPCEISAEFQCKRSGDWLQALSCLDSKRTYVSGNSGEDVKLDEQNITLITLDRVLLAYALFMGLDVIYTWIQNDSEEEEEIVEGEEDEDEDDDEEEEEAVSAVSATGRPRVILYFKRQRNINYVEKTFSLFKYYNEEIVKKGKIQKIKDYIVTYNGWIDSIRIRALNDINNFSACLKMDADIKRINPKNCESLLKAYWRYTAIDYVNGKLDSDKLFAVEADVKRIAGDFMKNKNDENAKLLINTINELTSQVDTFSNMMRNLVDENSVINANSSYLLLPNYKTMIELLVERESRGTADLVKLKIVETVGRLHAEPFGLSAEMFSNMMVNLEYYYSKMTSEGKRNLPIMRSFLDHCTFIHGKRVPRAVKEASAELALETAKDEFEKTVKMKVVAQSDPELTFANVKKAKSDFLKFLSRGRPVLKEYNKHVETLLDQIEAHLKVLPEGDDYDMFIDMRDIVEEVGSTMNADNIELMKSIVDENSYVDSIQHRISVIRSEKDAKREQLRKYQAERDNEKVYVTLSELRHLGVLLKELETIAADIASGADMDLFERKYAEKMRISTDLYDKMFSAEWRLKIDTYVLGKNDAALRVEKTTITRSGLSDEEKTEMQKFIDDSLVCIEELKGIDKRQKRIIETDLAKIGETVKESDAVAVPKPTAFLKTVVKTILDPDTYLNMIGWSMRYVKSLIVAESVGENMNVEQVEEVVEQGQKRQRRMGGGSVDKSTQFFFVMFLKQLYNTLNNFENGTDCNFIVCESLVRLAIAFCGTKVDMNNAEALFYNYLANGGWLKNDAVKFMKSVKFATEVSEFARGEALETMNLLYAKSDIPSLNSVNAVIPETAIEIYETLKFTTRGKLLNDRVKFLNEILQGLIGSADGDMLDITQYKSGVTYDSKEIYRKFKEMSVGEKDKAMSELFPKLPLQIQSELRNLQELNRRITYKRGTNMENRRQMIVTGGKKKTRRNKRKEK